METFWKNTMNCLLGTVLYHGQLPEEESWCEQYENEINNMIQDIKQFHKANTDTGHEVSNNEMARFLIYAESEHIGNKHIIKECAINEEQLLMIASKINDKLSMSHKSLSMLPCPFCGSKGYIDRCINGYLVTCPNCKCSSGAYEKSEKAIKAWNHRISK